jgi:hypothetical protein
MSQLGVVSDATAGRRLADSVEYDWPCILRSSPAASRSTRSSMKAKMAAAIAASGRLC